MMMTEIRSKSYSELIRYSTFEDRLNYLMLHGSVGFDTFGFDRFLNQAFYRSREWQLVKQQVIVRDNGCDLGVKGYEIPDSVHVFVHHINPITADDVKNHNQILLDPENLITTTFNTHQIIHYGLQNGSSPKLPIDRKMNDTCPWRS